MKPDVYSIWQRRRLRLFFCCWLLAGWLRTTVMAAWAGAAASRRALHGCRRLSTAALSGTAPVLLMYTGNQCSLCDDARAVLDTVARPFQLEQINISDAEHAHTFYPRYKWDIPVFYIGGAYFAKHRITASEVERALAEASEAKFTARAGEPDSRSGCDRAG